MNIDQKDLASGVAKLKLGTHTQHAMSEHKQNVVASYAAFRRAFP